MINSNERKLIYLPKFLTRQVKYWFSVHIGTVSEKGIMRRQFQKAAKGSV
jgi:hypothetical protein